MTKTLAITAIVLVAVIMGLSIVPATAQPPTEEKPDCEQCDVIDESTLPQFVKDAMKFLLGCDDPDDDDTERCTP